MKKDIIVSALLTIFGLGAAFAAGYLTHQWIYPPELELPILSQAKNIVENHAYYPIPGETDLEYGMIRGLLTSLNDPYASFIEPVQHELEQDTFQGEFGGIGAQVSTNEEGQIVLFPLAESPAREVGILDGDVIDAVNEIQLTPEMDLNQVVGMIRGPVGETVTLKILRPPQMEEFTFEIKRQRFSLPSITWRPLDQYPNIGLIDINLFAASTPTEVTSAIEELQADGVEFFIIDLQGNGGGLLDSGIDLARLFLDDGEILNLQYRGQDIETYKVTKAGPFSELPLVILTDHNTASASEIFAGALQVHQRAKLIGAPTFGKNTIQLIFTMEDESSVHITSAVWWLQGSGPEEEFTLTPDIEISPENFSYETVLGSAVEELTGQ